MAFKRLDPEDFVVSTDSVTSTVWSSNVPSLNTYATSSVQKDGTSGAYYLNVFQTSSTEESSAIQFAIAYGNPNGGGAVLYDDTVPNLSPSTSIYGQYRTLILEDENSKFVFGTDFTGSTNDFYAINIERARYKQSLLPGSMNLVLKSNNTNTAGTAIQLTDDSGMVSLPTYYGTQRAYQVISGSNGQSYDGGTGYTLASGSYGLFLPDISVILLNAAALDDDTLNGGGINLATNTSSIFADNPGLLYDAISSSMGVTGITSAFELNSQENITSDFVFIRTRNTEFNYSENPSFISGSTGEVIYTYFINNPTTYPTTVGLYNDNNDLLAVAKLSKPLQKDFTKEALVRVKLDF